MTVGRDIGGAYARSCVVWVVSVVIVGPLACCGIMATLWLVNTAEEQPAAWLFIAIMWLIPLALLAAIPFVAVVRRARKLDALFVPLGLQGSAYQSFFRQYHGAVRGRQVDAFFWRGPFLQIEVATPLMTRMGITGPQSDTRWFADLAGRAPLHLDNPDLAALMVFADDEWWARALLADRTATDALRRLTALGTTIFTRQQVILRPGAMTLLLSGNRNLWSIDIGADQVRLWVDDLVRLAQAAERIPAPTVTAQESSAEALNRRLRAGNPYLALWIGLGFFVGIVGLGILITVVILALG